MRQGYDNGYRYRIICRFIGRIVHDIRSIPDVYVDRLEFTMADAYYVD